MVALFFRMVFEEFDQRWIWIILHGRFVHAAAPACVGPFIAEVVGGGDFDDMAARKPIIKIRRGEFRDQHGLTHLLGSRPISLANSTRYSG